MKKVLVVVAWAMRRIDQIVSSREKLGTSEKKKKIGEELWELQMGGFNGRGIPRRLEQWREKNWRNWWKS